VIHFRIRDYVSVLLYRALSPAFAAFGRKVRIVWPLRIVGSACIELADRVTLHYGAYIAVLRVLTPDPRLSIGGGSMIGNHAHIIVTRNVHIGSNVLVADRVYIADNRHGYENPAIPVINQDVVQLADVRIGDDTWIGENVCIIGCSIGKHSVIGANSVVTRDVPDYCVVAGAPAVVVKRFCESTRSWRSTNPAGDIRDGCGA
jgi:acetyltransferase-like isoleucine patch superfamily enzyme